MNPASVLVASLLAFLIPHASSGRTLVLSYIGAAGSKKKYLVSLVITIMLMRQMT